MTATTADGEEQHGHADQHRWQALRNHARGISDSSPCRELQEGRWRGHATNGEGGAADGFLPEPREVTPQRRRAALKAPKAAPARTLPSRALASRSPQPEPCCLNATLLTSRTRPRDALGLKSSVESMPTPDATLRIVLTPAPPCHL